MAIKRPFTDACGNEFEQAYFRVAQINISEVDKVANLVFYAYKDEDAYLKGLQPLLGGVRSYALTGPAFEEFAKASGLYSGLESAAESYVIGKTDVETVDRLGKTESVSFFADAVRD